MDGPYRPDLDGHLAGTGLGHRFIHHGQDLGSAEGLATTLIAMAGPTGRGPGLFHGPVPPQDWGPPPLPDASRHRDGIMGR